MLFEPLPVIICMTNLQKRFLGVPTILQPTDNMLRTGVSISRYLFLLDRPGDLPFPIQYMCHVSVGQALGDMSSFE